MVTVETTAPIEKVKTAY